MRLSPEEIETIKSSVMQLDNLATIYLFGSRVDDAKKGGDIDLLILSKHLTHKDISTIRWNFYDHFGEQKMDIIIDDGDLNNPFVKKIYPHALKL